MSGSNHRTRLVGVLFVGLLVLIGTTAIAIVLDSDNDTISDADEGTSDVDGDKKPNNLDPDSDGDGIDDIYEAGDALLSTPPIDTDNDKTPDFLDVDSDDDKVPDAVEDANGNGKVDKGETSPLSPDSDGDGIEDGQEDKNWDGEVDPGECDPLNVDSDGDKILDDADKCCSVAEDFDGLMDSDGCPEDDADNDQIMDSVEKGHSCLDPLKSDTDGDGLIDGAEDTNKDGVVDKTETDPCAKDTDKDGIPDGRDKCPLEPEDYDGYQDRDGCPEANTDGGISDAGVSDAEPKEGGVNIPKDTDGDKLSDVLEMKICTDYQNPDTDGDGRLDGDEDENRNGQVDTGETDPCQPNIFPRGGAGCTIGLAVDCWPVALVVLLLCGLFLRRRQNPR